MASRSYSLCLKALRSQARPIVLCENGRTYTSTPTLHVGLPEPNATPASSIAPVTPIRVPGRLNSVKESVGRKAAAELKRVAGRATETYTVYGVTEALFQKCASKADYCIPQAADPDAEMPKTEDGEDLGAGSGWWHQEIGLKPTFSTWSQVTMLHMYILAVRFRCLPAEQSVTWQQHLLDHFFYDAENKMTINHHMHARGTRNRYLKDLFIQWRGLLAAYDEGLVKGDAVLAAAIWRNIFKANEEVDITKLATIVSYLRRACKSMEILPEEKLRIGDVQFSDPSREATLVRDKSKMMDLPFTDDAKKHPT